MSKSMLMGVVAGIGVATAGGVAGYQFLGQKTGVDEQGSNTVIEEQAAPEQQAPVVVARAETAKPAAKPASAPRTAAAAPAAAPKEECWDEEVTVQADPKDQHAIAGTALGAAVGGAIGSDVGDKKITTAAAAAAGAFIGRKIQKKIQENKADERTETRTVRKCGPAGTPH